MKEMNQEPVKTELFKDRHPILHHLRERSRILGATALAIVAAGWFCWLWWAGAKRVENTFFRPTPAERR